MSFRDVPGQQQPQSRRQQRPPSYQQQQQQQQGPRTTATSSGGYYSNGSSTSGRGASASAGGGARGGGFGSAGPLRTGGVSLGGGGGGGSALHHGGVSSRPMGGGTKEGAAGASNGGGSSGGGKVGDYLMVYSQNITTLHRMVQQLGTGRDTGELRSQCKCQLQVVDELRGKIQAQLQLQQQQAEGASRQDAARLGAMNSKLTKDFKRVDAIALDLGAQATRRMREVDTQRQLQAEEDEERARVAFAGADRGQQQGMLEVQQRRERVQMQEEAINTAIIQETEEELQQINKSLYKVNEIYRDLANIVDQQQEAVETIETNTEGAHARAQEGLNQVQKANDYQTSCVVS
ncbi:unnamed protein product [Pylaiella littoralis]